MTHTYAAYKRPTSEQKTYTNRKWRVGIKTFQANGHERKSGVAIFISDKIDFKTKAIKRDKESHYILFEGKSIKKI